MIVYFYGEDTFAAREAIASRSRDTNATLHWLEKYDLEEKSLPERLADGGQGLFGSSLFVIRNPSKLPKSIQTDIQDSITNKNASAMCIVWEQGKGDGRSELGKALKSIATQFTYPSNQVLVAWIIEEGKKLEVTISPNLAQQLIAVYGKDRFALRSEIQKLSLMETPESIQRDDRIATTTTIFELVRAIAAGQRQQALTRVEQALNSGENELYILTMIAYQYRTLLTIRTALDMNIAPSALAKHTTLNPFVIEQNVPFAKRFTALELLHVLVRILATDNSIKTGKVQARTGLLLLIIALVQGKP